MKKTKLNPADCAVTMMKALKPGILLTTCKGDFINSMVIGWGTIGVNWGRPVFVTYVRESRYSRQLLDANPEFTINIPAGSFNPEILKLCGSRSGRDIDKIKQVGLTPVRSEIISVPGIKEFPMTLECRVLYSQKQNPADLPVDIGDKFYPEDESGFRDAHIAYYGEIVDAYLIED